MRKKGAPSDGTFLGNVLPISIVEFNLRGQRFADQFFWVIGSERSVTAKQYVCYDAEGMVNIRSHKKQKRIYPIDQISTGFPCPFLSRTSGAT